MIRIKYGEAFTLKVSVVRRVNGGRGEACALSGVEEVALSGGGLRAAAESMTVDCAGGVITAAFGAMERPRPKRGAGGVFALEASGADADGRKWRTAESWAVGMGDDGATAGEVTLYLDAARGDGEEGDIGGGCGEECEAAIKELDETAVRKPEVGAADGVAPLDAEARLPEANLPEAALTAVTVYDPPTSVGGMKQEKSAKKSADEGCEVVYRTQGEKTFLFLCVTEDGKSVIYTDWADSGSYGTAGDTGFGFAAVLPTEGGVYKVNGTLYICADGKFVALREDYAALRGTAETLKARSEKLRVLPFGGFRDSGKVQKGLLYDAETKAFISRSGATSTGATTDYFAEYGYTEADYNTDGKARTGQLYYCQGTLYRAGEDGALEEYCADELRRIEELKKAASLVRLYSKEGGKALVDGYPVTLPAGELKCVHAFSSFETNGVECQMIDVSRLYTAGWTSMNGMFRNFQEGSLDLTDLDTESVTEWTDMFAGCDYLNELTLGEGFFKACLNAKVTECHFDAVADWTEDSMRQSLVTNSYDLASEGRACRIYLAPDAYGRLTEEDLETMAGKGYTVTEVALENGIESGIWQS